MLKFDGLFNSPLTRLLTTKSAPSATTHSLTRLLRLVRTFSVGSASVRVL